jgi:hypothetical protein
MKRAQEYDAKLERQTKQDPEKYGGRTWKDGRIESTHRTWELWRINNNKSTFFSLAARLVALAGSSAKSNLSLSPLR